MDNFNNIQNYTLDQIIKALKEWQREDMITDFITLKSAAFILLEKIEDILKNYSNLKTNINRSNIKSNISQLYQAIREKINGEELTQEITKQCQQFQLKVNQFLGRTILLTFVDKNGQIFSLTESSVKELYSKVTKNSKGERGNLTSSKFLQQYNSELQKNSMDEILKMLNLKIQNSINKRIEVYKTLFRRFYNSKHYLPKRRFYWLNDERINNDNHSRLYNQLGNIKETYANMVINEDPHMTNQDIQHGIYWIQLNNHPNSIPALIKGDVVLDDNGNIQFAIKSGNFSTGRFGQYIRLAFNITQINDKDFSKEDLEKYLKSFVNISKVSDEIINNINENANKFLNQEIKGE